LESEINSGIKVLIPHLQEQVENALEQNEIYEKMPGKIEELVRKEAYDIAILEDKISVLDEETEKKNGK